MTRAQAHAQQSVSLAWSPPNCNGVTGYALYLGHVSGNYARRINVGTNTTVTLTGLTSGQTNCCVVRAYNAAGLEGPASTEAQFISGAAPVPVPAPAPAPIFTPPSLQISKGTLLKVSSTGTSNFTGVLQSSTDLMQWTSVYTNTAGAALNYSVALPQGADWRFYRTAWVAGGVDSNSVAQALSKGFVSANAVGYASVKAVRGYTLLANPFDTGTNTLAALLPSVPDGCVLYKYTTGQGYTSNVFSGGHWSVGTATLDPGDGGFLQNQSRSTPTLIFAGRVLQGSVTNYIPAGYSIASAAVPRGDSLSTFPGVNGDVIQCYRTKWISYTNISGTWVGASKNGPLVLKPGGAFFITKQNPANWVQSFWPNN